MTILSADCILQAQSGEPLALAHLTRTILPLVERQLTRYPLSEEDRYDVLQSTLLQVVRRIGSFRGQSDFRTWLFRVTANEALMLMRSQRRHRSHLVHDADMDDLKIAASFVSSPNELGDASALQTERDGYVRDAVAQLPSHYRDVVTAHYHQDLGLQEIADRFHMSESAVRSRLHRARSRLRTLLAASPYAGDEAMPELAGMAA